MGKKSTQEVDNLSVDFEPCGPLADGYSCGYMVDGELETLSLTGPTKGVKVLTRAKYDQLLTDYPFAFSKAGEPKTDPGNKAGMPPNPSTGGGGGAAGNESAAGSTGGGATGTEDGPKE